METTNYKRKSTTTVYFFRTTQGNNPRKIKDHQKTYKSYNEARDAGEDWEKRKGPFEGRRSYTLK